jgi:hypothetical protein
MQSYDFDDFIARMSRLDYPEILRQANSECGRAENAGSRQREQGSIKYAERIKAFLFYMQHGTRPSSATDHEFARYRPVVEALVEKGQYTPEALQRFDRDLASG